MTSRPSPTIDGGGSGDGHRRSTWPMLAGFLLLGELLWLLGRFTTATTPGASSAWLQLLSKASALPQLFLAILTAWWLFRARGPTPHGRLDDRAPRSTARVLAVLVAQLASFALLFLASAALFESAPGQPAPSAWSFAGWAALAVTTAFLGTGLILPFGTLLARLPAQAGSFLGACCLGVTGWLAGKFVARDLEQELRAPTLWLAERLLGLLERDVVADLDTFVFGTAGFQVNIEPQCSGFEGIGLMVVFAGTYLWVFRGTLSFVRALLLFAVGVLCVWFVNVLRLVALVLLGTHVSPELAMGGFHSLAGTFAFCLVALGLVAVSRRRYFAPKAPTAEQSAIAGEPDATAAHLAPFLILVALGMIATAERVRGDLLVQPLKVVAAGAALWLFRREYRVVLRRSVIPAILLGALVFVSWLAIPNPSTAGGGSRVARPGPDVSGLAYASWVALRIVGSVVVHPLAEELAFRGFLMRRLTARAFESIPPQSVSILAWGFSSILFGLLHQHWIAATLAGAIYGYAYLRRGELGDAVLAHAITNALLVVLAVQRGDWSIL